MKICVIGNSHLAALRHGLDQCATRHDFVTDWFGAPGNRFGDFAIENGSLIPRNGKMRESFAQTSGGRESISLGDYQAFAFAGLLGIRSILDVYGANRTFEMSGNAAQRLVSRNLLSCLVRSSWERSPVLAMARSVRALVSVPVMLVEQARPAISANEPGRSSAIGRAVASAREAVRSGDAGVLANVHERLLGELEREGFCVVRQPPATVVDHLRTDQRYSDGSRRLQVDEAHASSDIGHMNGAYGALVMADIFARAKAG